MKHLIELLIELDSMSKSMPASELKSFIRAFELVKTATGLTNEGIAMIPVFIAMYETELSKRGVET